MSEMTTKTAIFLGLFHFYRGSPSLTLSLSLLSLSFFLSLNVQLNPFYLCRSVEIAMCHFWGLTIIFVNTMLYIAF